MELVRFAKLLSVVLPKSCREDTDEQSRIVQNLGHVAVAGGGNDDSVSQYTVYTRYTREAMTDSHVPLPSTVSNRGEVDDEHTRVLGYSEGTETTQAGSRYGSHIAAAKERLKNNFTTAPSPLWGEAG